MTCWHLLETKEKKPASACGENCVGKQRKRNLLAPVGETVWENNGFCSCAWHMTQAGTEILWREKKGVSMCLFLDIEFLEEEKKGATHRSSQWTGAAQMRSDPAMLRLPLCAVLGEWPSAHPPTPPPPRAPGSLAALPRLHATPSSVSPTARADSRSEKANRKRGKKEGRPRGGAKGQVW